MPSKVVSLIAAVGITAGLSACGNTQVTGAIPVSEVQSQNLISATAPGETAAVTWHTNAGCKGGIATPTIVTKEFSSTSSVSSVKDFYNSLATQGQWFHRQDQSGFASQTLNFSKTQGENYWELHVSLPSSVDNRYTIQLDAYNPHASCG